MAKHDNRFPVVVSGTSVEVGDNFEYALRKFKRKAQDAGIVQECRDRMHHTTKTESRRKSKKQAKVRNRKRIDAAQPNKRLF